MSFNRKEQRALRHRRLRQRVRGTAARPRMAICISNKHMYVQFIDDDAQRTLAATSTLNGDEALKCNLGTAKLIGGKAAEAAKAKGISFVVVDRGGNKYHGRIRAIVEAAVAGGLKISDHPLEPFVEKKHAAKAAAPEKKPAAGHNKPAAAKPAAAQPAGDKPAKKPVEKPKAAKAEVTK